MRPTAERARHDEPSQPASPPPIPVAGATPPPPLPRRASQSATKTGTSRRELDPEQVERSRQRQEFARVKNIVFTVRSVYWSGVVFAVVQLLLFHVVLSPLFVIAEASTVNVVVGAISWAQLGLMIAGARLVMRSPFVWTLVGAIYWTLGTGQAIWVATLGDGALLKDSLVLAYLTMMVFMVLAFWFAVGQAKRVQRLMAANPELQLQRKRLEPEQLGTGGIAEDARMRRNLERRRSNATQLRLIAVGLGVSALFAGGAWWLTRPPSVDDSVQLLEQRWQSGELQQLCALFDGGENGRAAVQLRDGLVQRGWHQAMPKLQQAVVDGGDQSATFRYPCDGGTVTISWSLGKAGWRVRSVSLPDLVVGDIAAGVAAFRAAWDSSGPDALLALIRSEDHKIATGVQRILKGRDWLEARPPLGDEDVGSLRSGGRVRVMFSLPSKDLSVTLQYWHPGWRISSLGLR